MEASCSDTSQVFCPSSGQCAAHCPLVEGTSNYTCDASEPVFCPFAGQVCSGAFYLFSFFYSDSVYFTLNSSELGGF